MIKVDQPITFPGVILETETHILGYDPDDVEGFEFSTPYDHIVLPDDGSGVVRRQLGQAHLELKLHFLPGKAPRWIEKS